MIECIYNGNVMNVSFMYLHLTMNDHKQIQLK